MKTIIKVFVFNMLLLSGLSAYGQIGFHIYIGPPAPRQEVVVVRPSPEVVWVPGYYEYDPVGTAYIWVPGKWSRPPRPGAVWIAPKYKKHGKEYHFSRGRWK